MEFIKEIKGNKGEENYLWLINVMSLILLLHVGNWGLLIENRITNALVMGLIMSF